MSTPWRIALVVALVLLGIGGGTCALRTARMIEKEMEQRKVREAAGAGEHAN